MATAADIAVQSSNYTGDKNLGGGDFGVAKIDTSPIQNLAHYTFLYNKDKHEQREKEANDMIKQLADLTDFDPNSAIPHDRQAALEAAKNLIDKGNEFARTMYTSPQDKISKQWEFQKGIADTMKTVDSIKARAIAYNKRLQDINNNTAMSEEQKKIKRSELEAAANSDVHTPIAAEDKFDETVPEITAGTARKVAVTDIGSNNNLTTKISLVTSSDLLRQAQAESTGIEAFYNGEHKEYFKAGKNPFTVFHNSADAYNAALLDERYQKKDKTGAPVLENGVPAVDYEAIKRSNPLLHDINSVIDGYNQWATQMKMQATAGVFTDQMGKQFKSTSGVTADDFFTIEKGKPLTGDQIIMLEKWRKTPHLVSIDDKDIQHTGEANDLLKERMRLANAKEINANTQANENWRATLGLIKDGFTRDANGKWVKETTTTSTGNGTIPYWENNILPQINSLKPTDLMLTKETAWYKDNIHTPMPSNYSGDVDIAPDKISGLSIALAGEKDDKGKEKGFTKKSKTKIRFENGTPVGVVIDGVFFDGGNINAKATTVQDKAMSGKTDAPLFGGGGGTTTTTTRSSGTKTTSKGLPILK